MKCHCERPKGAKQSHIIDCDCHALRARNDIKLYYFEREPKVEKLKTLEQNDIAKPTNLVGEPTVGVDPDFVTTVGLGKLKVTTARGYKDTNNSKED